jgi:hypothetical protein
LEVFDDEAHPDDKLLTKRNVVYPKFLDKLELILATWNMGMDSQDSRWPAYEAILTQSTAWRDDCWPITLPEGEGRLSQWPELARNLGEWIEDAKRIAVSGYKHVLEDGPEFCSSESKAENSDHGEALTSMYTTEMLGKNGNPDMGRAPLQYRRNGEFPSGSYLSPFSRINWQSH